MGNCNRAIILNLISVDRHIIIENNQPKLWRHVQPDCTSKEGWKSKANLTESLSVQLLKLFLSCSKLL